jgi:AAA+ ATPase superfamily predicted ATPase
VEELFKFFIKLTKVNHLAHVICLTSDSYYIEELYNHAKLKNTSDYYLVEHLEKKDVLYWLKELE